MRGRVDPKALALALVAATPLSLALAASVGSSGLGPFDLLRAVGEKLGLLSPVLSDTNRTILLNVRLARVALAWGVGGALSASGAAFQGLLLNPLADPYTVGVSSGAALGASIAIMLGLGGYTLAGLGGLPLAAFAGALLALWAVHFLSSRRGFAAPATLILSGIVVSTTLQAAISLIKSLNEDSVSSIVFWIMGSMANKGWAHAAFCLPYVLAAVALMIWYARDLDLMALGDEGARQLGVDAPKVRRILLIAASLATGASVAVSGVIGFIGLVVPHLVRGATGPSHRQLVVNSFLGGGVLLVLADAASRTVLGGGEELPVGVVTALIGGPFFCWLLGRAAPRSEAL